MGRCGLTYKCFSFRSYEFARTPIALCALLEDSSHGSCQMDDVLAVPLLPGELGFKREEQSLVRDLASDNCCLSLSVTHLESF